VFTGIVEEVGRVLERRESRLVVSAAVVGEGTALGASIAVSGACLTVVDVGAGRLGFDVGPETAERTTLGALCAGDRVNLERPLRLGGLVGGHLVQGHVDGVGTVVSLRRDGESARLTVQWRGAIPGAALIPQGSVAVDGVSLTVAALRDGAFEIMLIPHTLAHTTLGGLEAGMRVNLETDMIGKYVERVLAVRGERA
jgi:riboflavin synthase